MKNKSLSEKVKIAGSYILGGILLASGIGCATIKPKESRAAEPKSGVVLRAPEDRLQPPPCVPTPEEAKLRRERKVFPDIKNFLASMPWQKIYGGNEEDQAFAIQQTIDGGYIVVGMTKSYGSGDFDLWVIKINSEGRQVWDRTFGGDAVDRAWAVDQTSDGGFIIAGDTMSYGAGNADVWLIKIDSEGQLVWDRTFGGDHWDGACDVQQTSDGGFLVTGPAASYGSGHLDFWIIKTDSSGSMMWNKTFGGANRDESYSIQQTTDGGYIIVGYTTLSDGSEDILMIKTDSSGNKEWEKLFGGSDNDRAYSVQQTTDGGYIVAGSTRSYGSAPQNIWLIKTNSTGTLIWNKTFGGGVNTDRYDPYCDVRQTTDGGYIVAGYTGLVGADSEDVFVIKTDSLGNMTWYKILGGSSNDKACSIQQTIDGGYIVAGGYSFATSSGDYYLIKLDAYGNTGPNP